MIAGSDHTPWTRVKPEAKDFPDAKPPARRYMEVLENQTANASPFSASLNQKKSLGAKREASMVGLTIGTGLGAGLILNGKLYSGPNCGAGEIGCLPYLDGNLERYVSGAFFNKNGQVGESYYALALNGDKSALALYEQFGFHLGQAIKIIMYTYDPDLIVLGGSVSLGFKFFQLTMAKTMIDFDYPGILKKISIQPSSLQHSAILGAASLYFDYVKG